jgi:hypothetical protein
MNSFLLFKGISKSFYICGGVDFVVLSLFVLYQIRLSLIKQTANAQLGSSSDINSKTSLKIKNENKKKLKDKPIENKKKPSNKKD